MNRQEATEQYQLALKAGQRYQKDCVLHGKSPYPQVLDDIINENMYTDVVDLGLLQIPTEQIVGTKEKGRTSAFAGNFMPLLSADSEFGIKWISLCMAHLSSEGIRDPIECYEYLGKFYVQEGNKRVSVMKSYDAPLIPAHVVRVIPAYSQDPEIQVYYEFMRFYQLSGIYQVTFEELGSYAKLQAALGYEPDHVWTDVERQSFLSGFTYFKEAYRKLGGEETGVSASSALKVWLRVYPFEDLKKLTDSEIQKRLQLMWGDVKLQAAHTPIAVSTTAQDKSENRGILNRLFSGVRFGHLNVAFIYEKGPLDSAWANSHDLGRQYAAKKLKGKVSARTYIISEYGGADETMDRAVADGAQVIFGTTPTLMIACRKAAVKYPKVRILNCSVSMPYTGIRSYYSRVYEGKFITGAIAGALAANNHIGYVANYPILGVPASINAFALGAQLTNPRARIQLHWSCTPGTALDLFTRKGISVISGLDTPNPDQLDYKWGAYQVQEDGSLQALASPVWHWGKFYEKMLRSILNGNWDHLDVDGTEKAVNYWWGMDAGVIDVRLGEHLPQGVVQLADFLRKGIVEGTIAPFARPVRSQDGILRNDGSKWFSTDDILYMDWLCDNVEGSIPAFDEILPMSQPLVRLLGIYRDSIPPEKGEALL